MFCSGGEIRGIGAIIIELVYFLDSPYIVSKILCCAVPSFFLVGCETRKLI
jgi:hypothetical protein